MKIFDTETYRNYFLFAAICETTGKTIYVEMFNDSKLDTDIISRVLKKNTTVGFNSNKYDLPIIAYALNRKKNNSDIKDLSDEIIKTNIPAWKICKGKGIVIPNNWDSIDLIDVAPGMASLKIYGGRLNAPKMQDLPIHPDKILTREEADSIREYCLNDLHTTLQLYQALKPQINLRVIMGEEYGMDLRSKSDAQIAETVIKSELQKLTDSSYYAPKLIYGYTFRYQNPGIINFKSEKLQAIFEQILVHDFTLRDNGSVLLPAWLSKNKITIGNGVYQMGIGGLHSTEKAQYVVPNSNQLLFDLDVASYYPSIILQQNLAPESLGVPFLKVYQSIVDRRIKAKRDGDELVSSTNKLVINSSFGKLGSKFSMLYAPELLLQTTLTGQLALLMLIDDVESAGVSVMSANTDGIVILIDKADMDTLDEITFNWMMDTSYNLERTDYVAIASRDVNNYLAVKPDGKVKGKGVFTSPGLQKNPDRTIIYEAVAAYLAKDVPIEKTLSECVDITKFITVRRVEGGAVWLGDYLGKAIRFYHCSTVDKETCIHYNKNNNRVPNSAGCRPLMELPDMLPNDIDYDYYINEAKDLLKEVGYEYVC